MATDTIGKKQAVLRSALVITVIIIISKLFGFVREMVFAAYFGTGVMSDAYTNANTIVNVFILLFSACISSTFIPIYTRTLHDDGKRAANGYANNILCVFAIAGVAVGLLGFFFAPAMCELFMPTLIPTAEKGTALFAEQAEKLKVTADMARIMFPSMVFAACTGVFTSLLNAHERFVPEQLIGFALSACVIGACVIFPQYGITAVAIATALTYCIQLLIIAPFLRGIFKFRPTLKSSGRVKRTLMLALPAILSMALDEINHLVDKNVGISLGDGPNTALTYAYRIIMLILGVLVVPITTVMFSKLSQYAAANKKKRIISTTKQCLELLSLVVIPVIILAAVQSEDVIRILYFRGKFDEYSLSLTSSAFFFYVLGVLAFAWRSFLTRVFYAVQDTKAPMIIGAVSVAVNILLDILLAKWMGVGGLTLATSVAGFVAAALMLLRMRRKIGKMGFATTLLEVCKITVAACIAGFVTVTVSGLIQLASASLVLRLVTATVCGVAVYIIVALLFRVSSVGPLVYMVYTKLRRKRGNNKT